MVLRQRSTRTILAKTNYHDLHPIYTYLGKLVRLKLEKMEKLVNEVKQLFLSAKQATILETVYACSILRPTKYRKFAMLYF